MNEIKPEKWRAPSNIALVKYWGKHGVQLPMNPSISFTLDKAYTETEVLFLPDGERNIDFLFEGKEKHGFLPKLQQFLVRIEPYCPWLSRYSLEISTSNSFPHSSGIASSASGMAALSLCITAFEAKMEGTLHDLNKASTLARLGSGSACRSLRGGFNLWGACPDVSPSSDEYAVNLAQVHPDFLELQDTILLVDKGEKKVSSSLGHKLMDGHPYAGQRFLQAKSNTSNLLRILKMGDFMALAELMEQEALALHAMMMTSSPHFMLFMPSSIAIIRRVMELRAEGLHISFTVDAGANIHLIYPKVFSTEIMEIVQHELLVYCHAGAYLCDRVGQGPIDLNT
jgi:diphosphomevalonate decarboxylase